MAGEYKLARELLGSAAEKASEDRTMSPETLNQALLVELLSDLCKQHSRKQLDDMIAYHLDHLGEDEFVVTRGS